MKNFRQKGETLALVAPYDVASGAGFLVGAIFAVAKHDAVQGETVQGATEGVYDLSIDPDAEFAQGARAFWDAAAKVITDDPAGNKLVGVVVEDVADAMTVAPVKLIDDTGALMPVDAAAVVEIAAMSATASLNFPAIAAGAQADLTIAVPGAEVGDAVEIGLASAPAAGLVFNAFVSAADTVTVRASNISAAPVDAAAATFRVTVTTID